MHKNDPITLQRLRAICCRRLLLQSLRCHSPRHRQNLLRLRVINTISDRLSFVVLALRFAIVSLRCRQRRCFNCNLITSLFASLQTALLLHRPRFRCCGGRLLPAFVGERDGHLLGCDALAGADAESPTIGETHQAAVGDLHLGFA